MFLPATGLFLAGLAVGAYVPFLPITVFILLALFGIGLTILEHRAVLTRLQGLFLFSSLLLGMLWSVVGGIDGTPLKLVRGDSSVPVTMEGTVVEPIHHAPDRIMICLLYTSPSPRDS